MSKPGSGFLLHPICWIWWRIRGQKAPDVNREFCSNQVFWPVDFHANWNSILEKCIKNSHFSISFWPINAISQENNASLKKKYLQENGKYWLNWCIDNIAFWPLFLHPIDQIWCNKMPHLHLHLLWRVCNIFTWLTVFYLAWKSTGQKTLFEQNSRLTCGAFWPLILHQIRQIGCSKKPQPGSNMLWRLCEGLGDFW